MGRPDVLRYRPLPTLPLVSKEMIRLLFFFFLLLSGAISAAAQNEALQRSYLDTPIKERSFNRRKWESLKKGMDYTQPKSDKKREYERDLIERGKAIGSIVKYIIFVLAVALIVLLIVQVIRNRQLFGRRNRAIESSVSGIDLEKIEDDLQNADLETPIRQAVTAGNFPLAVRLYYLALLKELSLKKYIRWKRDKTNGEYLRELAGSPLFASVQAATLNFERVWYGKASLNQENFHVLEKQFETTIKTVIQ